MTSTPAEGTPTDALPLADALIRVPRHLFVPDQAWAGRTASAPGHWIDRTAEPEPWWRAVCSEASIYTQLDDGRTPLTAENAARTFAPTCSASSPVLVTAFLRSLAPRPGDRILEIGTGTGWTAGLLSYLTGAPEHVTTVEVDPGLAACARRNLESARLRPRLIVGDGAEGCAEHAPYDGVHVTCGLRTVPYSWVEQTRAGGVVVLPYQPVMRLARLEVTERGTAVGRFGAACSYMLLRSQRRRAAKLERTAPRSRDVGRDPAHLLDVAPGLDVLLSGLVGDVPFRDGDTAVLAAAGSQAVLEANGRVTQTGSRNLWDEAEDVVARWRAEGGPGLDRIGLTVGPAAEFLWLDDPGVPVAEQFQWKRGR